MAVAAAAALAVSAPIDASGDGNSAEVASADFKATQQTPFDLFDDWFWEESMFQIRQATLAPALLEMHSLSIDPDPRTTSKTSTDNAWNAARSTKAL